MGEEWRGGDIANSPGGAFKINLLRKEMENHKDDDQLIVLFSDSYDVVAVGRYGSFKGFWIPVYSASQILIWPHINETEVNS